MSSVSGSQVDAVLSVSAKARVLLVDALLENPEVYHYGALISHTALFDSLPPRQAGALWLLTFGSTQDYRASQSGAKGYPAYLRELALSAVTERKLDLLSVARLLGASAGAFGSIPLSHLAQQLGQSPESVLPMVEEAVSAGLIQGKLTHVDEPIFECTYAVHLLPKPTDDMRLPSDYLLSIQRTFEAIVKKAS